MKHVNVIAIRLILLLLMVAGAERCVAVAQDAAMQTAVTQKPAQSSTGELTTKEKQLLDCLMLRLKRDPTATGWIRIDQERRRIDEPALTELVVHYLKSKYGTEFDRVSIMGDSRLAREMELFIIPQDGDPIPFPGKTSKSKCSKRSRSN